MDSRLLSSSGGATATDEHSDSRTESISSFFNPTHQPISLDTPSFSFFPPLNPTNIPKPVYNPYNPIRSNNILQDHPTFTSTLDATDHNCFNSQPPVFSSNTSMGRGSNHHHQVGVSTKNAKKRTRASKRPPTTVFTTDTSNFKQMVQEFTGIPTAPFLSYSRGLDRISSRELGPWYRVPPVRPKIQLQQPSFTPLNSQNPKLMFQESNDQRLNVLRGFTGSSTHWRSASDNMLPKQDEYELNKLNVDHLTNKGFESVISLGDDGDQVNGNVESWVLPF